MAFQQALSGLNAAAKNLDVIGNNVSNVNTIGFKGSRAEFADVFASTLAGSITNTQAGIGVRVANISQNFSQGGISVTDRPLDVAINGEGFFRMDDNGSVSYSRNGQFKADSDGYLVNSTNGLRLTGYGVDGNGNVLSSAPVPLRPSSPLASATARTSSSRQDTASKDWSTRSGSSSRGILDRTRIWMRRSSARLWRITSSGLKLLAPAMHPYRPTKSLPCLPSWQITSQPWATLSDQSVQGTSMSREG